MWGVLNRPQRRKSAPKRTFRPMLESLETRTCLSPVITSFSASPTNGPSSRQVELRGTVSDYHPEWDTVKFSGEASGSTTPDTNGNFDYFTTGLGLGTVTAVATRSPGDQSSPVNALITSAAPSITSFSVISNAPGVWTFKGTVADEAPWGIVVQFGGEGPVIGKTATCDQYGNFSATYMIPNMTQGTITAQCQDVWGLLSNTVYDPILPNN